MFSLGSFPEVGQKQKTQKEEEERAKVNDYNGRLNQYDTYWPGLYNCQLVFRKEAIVGLQFVLTMDKISSYIGGNQVFFFYRQKYHFYQTELGKVGRGANMECGPAQPNL